MNKHVCSVSFVGPLSLIMKLSFNISKEAYCGNVNVEGTNECCATSTKDTNDGQFTFAP